MSDSDIETILDDNPYGLGKFNLSHHTVSHIEEQSEPYQFDIIGAVKEYLDIVGESLNDGESNCYIGAKITANRLYKKRLKKIKKHLDKIDKCIIQISDTNIRFKMPDEKWLLVNLLKLLEVHIMLKLYMDI